MSTVPTKPDEAITWCQGHVTPWTENAALLNLDETKLTEFSALITAAADARQVAADAREAADTADENYATAVKAMRTVAGGQVSIIRATAKNAPSPQVIYAAALIPPPATPTPRPAPGTPNTVKVTLTPSGNLKFTFRCSNPRGAAVTYKIERSLGTQSAYEFLENAKERSFEDKTFPEGTSVLIYRITAQSTTKDGDAGEFLVRLSPSGNQATVTPLTGSKKRAA